MTSLISIPTPETDVVLSQCDCNNFYHPNNRRHQKDPVQCWASEEVWWHSH